MFELCTARKPKINIADYDFQQDIESRIALSDFSAFDFQVLEEILYSPLTISLQKICRNLDCDLPQLLPVFQKLEALNLLQLHKDTLTVDKERRKYFELQIARFSDDFAPDMEFLQNLLKHIPIHLLPTWYAIPRTSNNIFESLIEKYLLTPQIYQRYLSEINFSDPIINQIIGDVFAAPNLCISSSDLIAKYNLSRNDFEKILLQLEFHLVCFVSYIREDDHWHEWVMPLSEWREYLFFLQKTRVLPIEEKNAIVRHRPNDFAFIEDMSQILLLAQKQVISLPNWDRSSLPVSLVCQLAPICQIPIATKGELDFAQHYLHRVIFKLLLIKLLTYENKCFQLSHTADEWLNLNLENRALYLYRHPLNILSGDFPDDLKSERCLRAAEKSVKRVPRDSWVLIDDLIRSALVSFQDDFTISLKKTGRRWKYALPEYSDDEKRLIYTSIFDFLFECGMVTTGTIENRNCFALTAFGQFFFED